MPTQSPRVQVTVDRELADALEDVGRDPGVSRSRQIRDLALRGARAEADHRTRRREAIQFLLSIADDHRYDFEIARRLHEDR